MSRLLSFFLIVPGLLSSPAFADEGPATSVTVSPGSSTILEVEAKQKVKVTCTGSSPSLPLCRTERAEDCLRDWPYAVYIGEKRVVFSNGDKCWSGDGARSYIQELLSIRSCR